MKFHPIKYKQPVVGDSRCALYVLANLLNDNGILLLTDVGQMTSINQEAEILKKYNRVCDNTHICGILPYFIVPSTERIGAEQVAHIQPEKSGTFGIALIDCLAHDEVNAHTVGVFWFGSELAVLDPQKNEIQESTVSEFFNIFHVVGIRFIEDKNGEVPEFSMSDFPHIFDLNSQETHKTNEPCQRSFQPA